MNDVALVLGGGGVAGVAWITGVVAGLADEGIDLRDAQQILGTSAGSTVGAQLWSGESLDALFARQADPAHQTPELSPPWSRIARIVRYVPGHGARSPIRTNAYARSPAWRSTATPSAKPNAARSSPDGCRRTRGPRNASPLRRSTPKPASCGCSTPLPASSLVDAVAASCAVPMIWPATTIQGRRYVDGGMRSAENADLITGARSVLILSPSGIDAASLRGIGLRKEVEGLEANGMRVAVIEPDADARSAIGFNPLDPDTRTPSATAGRAQGRREATRIGAFLR